MIIRSAIKFFLVISCITSVITDARVYPPGVAERIVRTTLQQREQGGKIKNIREFQQAFQDLSSSAKDTYQDDYNAVLQAEEDRHKRKRLKKERLERKRIAKEKIEKERSLREQQEQDSMIRDVMNDLQRY